MTKEHKHHPPYWAIQFLHWYCPDVLLEEIEGDLLENFYRRVETKGITKARRSYVYDVVRFCNPTTFRKAKTSVHPYENNKNIILAAMFRNYVKVAFRHLGKYKYHNALNILSLVLGISCFAVILLYVRHELNYDKFHKNADRTYRITTHIKRGNHETKWAITNGYLVTLLPEQVPEVEKATKAQSEQAGLTLQVDDKFFHVPDRTGFFVDPNFLEVLDFEVIAGDVNTMLQEPNSILLTEALAKKYFNTTDVIGQHIIWKMAEEERILTVSGVLKDIPQNSHMQFDYLISGKTRPYWEIFSDPDLSKSGYPVYVYFLAHPEVSEEVMKANIARATQEGYPLARIEFPVQKLTDIYFYADNLFEHTKKGNLHFVHILTLVGFFILIIACINYVTLSTSKSLQRAREIGVRKAFGSSRKALIIQFLSESLLLSCLAGLISIAVVELSLRYVVPQWFDVKLSLLDQPLFLPALLLLSLLVGLLSGIFPALKISSFHVIKILRGTLKLERDKTFSVRSMLITLQFVFTITLIVGSIIVFKQLNYLENKDLGYNKEAVINIPYVAGIDATSWSYFKESIKREANVKSVGSTQYKFMSDYNGGWIRVLNQENNDTVTVRLQCNMVDYGFIPTMEMQMVEGRNFSQDFSTDTTTIIINEAAKRLLGLDTAVNQKVLNPYFVGENGGKIIGVVNDFHFQSFDREIIPIVLALKPDWDNNLLVRINTQQLQETLSRLKQIWQESEIMVPFEYSFLDDWFAMMIKKETQQSHLVTTFTVLAIIIAILGLLGLISYTTEQKKREIGIRKVYGATAQHILAMINQHYFKLYVLAFMMAVPLSLWGIHLWLQNFAYQVDIEVTDYVITAIVIFTIAVGTISFQALKAAYTNPVDTLKEE